MIKLIQFSVILEIIYRIISTKLKDIIMRAKYSLNLILLDIIFQIGAIFDILNFTEMQILRKIIIISFIIRFAIAY